MSQIQLSYANSGREANGLTHARAPLLSIQKLTVNFGKKKSLVRAVAGVSFEVYESEVFSLVGESGSGKTTIARCVSALSVPSSGSILWGKEVEVAKLKGAALKRYRKDVQIIFQDPFESLYHRQDVYAAVSAPLRSLTGEKSKSQLEEKVCRLLGEVGLDPQEHLHRLPHQLSGGERQRVNIARALAPEPRMLVADEPITMLDASQRLNVLSLLMRIKAKRNLTILLITHDLASAKLFSDRTAVVYKGRIVELGPTEGILSKPLHPYTELIMAATPKIVKGETRQSAYIDNATFKVGAIEESDVVKQGCVFRPRCKYATEVCAQVEPELLEKRQGQAAACHNPVS